ncbi:hypothetical protein GCM10027062_34010 [Nocardioides hungaricus]
MTTDQENAESAAPGGPEQRQPDWWHRDHPTFTALTGFFTGLAFLILVPALFAGILGLLFSYDRAERYFPFVLVTLVVPIGLVIWPRTRRFGLYLLIGMVTTAIVVGGVAAIVLWYLVTRQS